ncbi:uncharacterized protein N7469_009004 [Penicillium citrinum]|uniref:ER membrane protein complex subunit 7 beta-sandwich domain-containing protein n=1 Tax=Penicillium citrinum TaxID=5077 RepID=A0A9W9NMN7_PENCI|nr:uncharacterized protein N7469_009004 [Penicillium citrinum]KAJ5222764.1 hypothetical protein N7469_009004 [Penicillium citrinum]
MLLLIFTLLVNLAAASLTINIPPINTPPESEPSLTRSSTLVFRNIPSGHPESYLLDIRSSEYVFAPYRVDVAADGSILGVWETFRGNPWDNRGAEKYVVDVANKRTVNVIVEAKVLGRKNFYEERAKFSPLSLVKNPMILLAIVALVFTLGMPKLMENSTYFAYSDFSPIFFLQVLIKSVDPEMRAEFEQQQRASPISGAGSAMAGGGFDLAGWMAGTAPSPMANAEGATGATGREAGGNARRRA